MELTGKAESGLVLVRNDQKINFKTKGCRLLVIEPVHRSSNSVLKVHFFGTTCMYLFGQMSEGNPKNN